MASLKQKLALKNAVENGGNMSKAMRDAGYSANTAKTPQKLTESKAWTELVEEFLPDSLLTEKHLGLLNAVKENGEIDTSAVKAGLEMAYKIKGRFAPEKIAVATQAVIPSPETEAQVFNILNTYVSGR